MEYNFSGYHKLLKFCFNMNIDSITLGYYFRRSMRRERVFKDRQDPLAHSAEVLIQKYRFVLRILFFIPVIN